MSGVLDMNDEDKEFVYERVLLGMIQDKFAVNVDLMTGMFRAIQSEMERMFEDLRFDFDAYTKELTQEMVFKAIQQRLQDNG